MKQHRKLTRAVVILLSVMVGVTITRSQNCGFNPGLEEGQSICFGYALARATGLEDPTAWNANSIYTYRQYFNNLNTHIDYQAGDIIVFAFPGTDEEDITGGTGHATYVSTILHPPSGNYRDGVLYTGPDGKARDIDGINPIGDSNIICMQVQNAGGSEQTKTLAQVKADFPSYVAIGYYRLKDEYKCTLTFQTSFGQGWVSVTTWDDATTFVDRPSGWQTRLPRSGSVRAQGVATQQDNSNNWYSFLNRWTYSLGTIFQGTITATVSTQDETYTAQYAPTSPAGSQVSFENKWGTVSFGSIIKVNNEDKISPTRDFNLGATAIAYTTLDNNGLRYTFANWTPGGYTNPTLTPSAAGHYVANYTAVVLPPTYVTAGAPVGSDVTVRWIDNPNPGVTYYQIWRHTKWTSSEWIANVNHGIQQYTDHWYTVTGTGSDEMVFYEVKSYYQPNGTFSVPATAIVTATPGGIVEARKDLKLPEIVQNVPTEFSVDSYPNPFNPETEISFALPEPSSVRIIVSDMLGREIMRLVDRDYSAGYQKVTWKGTDGSGTKVGSGVYFCRIVATGQSGKQFTKVMKMALTK